MSQTLKDHTMCIWVSRKFQSEFQEEFQYEN